MATKALDRKQRAYPDAPHLWLPQLDAAYACRMPQGKYAQAEPFAKQALDIARETYGTRHPDYALALRDHGTATASMGDASGIDALEEAVPILEGVFGHRFSPRSRVRALATLW